MTPTQQDLKMIRKKKNDIRDHVTRYTDTHEEKFKGRVEP